MVKKAIMSFSSAILITAALLGLLSLARSATGSNIDPTDKFAWSSVTGWINFNPQCDGCQGVTVYADHLEGYAWSETIGWMRMGTHTGGSTHTYANTAQDNYGVNIDATGVLSGYAWSDVIGWINFDPNHGGVTVDLSTGEFDGYAWSESVGWIHFKHTAAPVYGVVAHMTTITPTHVSATGPTTGILHTPYTFTAIVSPITAKTPITYEWRTSEGETSTLTHINGLSDTAVLSWTKAGTHAITVTASNVASSVSATHAIVIAPITTHWVITYADAGAGSLRQALLDAQAYDTIRFDTTIFPPTSPTTITVLSVLPTLTQGHLTIDASDAGVVLDGRTTPADTDGLRIMSDGNQVKGLTLLNFYSNGIEISEGAKHNVIGGDFTVGSAPHGEGNIITANGGNGISIQGTGTMSNTVRGNLIGLDANGTRDWRIRAIVVSPEYVSDTTIFIGTQFHGVWRSTDGGEHWEALNSGLTTLDIRALAISPHYTSDRTLFAGTADGHIFKTMGGGLSWTQVDNGVGYRDVVAFAISPNYTDDRTIFAAMNGQGVVASFDGGLTWEEYNTGITDRVLHSIAMSPDYATDQTVFALAWRTVFKSMDGGQTWNAISENVIEGGHVLVISPNYTSDQTLFIGVHQCDVEDMLWTSTDGGETWQATGNDPDWCTIQSLAIAPNYPVSPTLIAGDDWGGIYRSNDSGTTWNKVHTTRYVWNVAFSTNWEQDTTVFAAQRTGRFFKSIDNGITWTHDSTGMTEFGNYWAGVDIHEGAQYNIIGGNRPVDRNIISHNGVQGVDIWGEGTDHNIVIGNYIGTTSNGLQSLGNGAEGFVIKDGPQYNEIGGAGTPYRNLISGNSMNGVSMWGTGTMSNVVSGNYVGVDVTGNAPLPNGGGVSMSNGTQVNQVGGTEEGAGNIISGNNSNGVTIDGNNAMSNTIIGNYIGINVTGTKAIPNYYSGVVIGTGAKYNRIGGDTTAERNIISGNRGDGVSIWETGTNSNTVIGNYIGLDATGTYSISNLELGIRIASGACYNRIGGETSDEGNIISGNRWSGIGIYNAETISNTISKNIIGANATGDRRMGNQKGITCENDSQHNVISENLIVANRYNGIHLDSCDYTDISANHIGINASGALNLGNGENGISLFNGAEGNTIGPDNVVAHNERGIGLWDPDSLYNTITQNSIYHNDLWGIEIGNGGNAELSPPVLAAATNLVNGIVLTAPVTIEIFSDDEDEGRVYEGTTMTDAEGKFSYHKPEGFTGPYLTATATDEDGNTSQFSTPILVTGCTGLTSAAISGPTSGYTDTAYTFTSTLTPTDPTQPVTLTWSPAPVNGQGTLTATYQWAISGIHAITLTAENCRGQVVDTHQIAISSPPATGNYEPNDACTQATFIATDGVPQVHTFHDEGDEDWIAFQATAGITYVIEARVPPTSSADVMLEMYDTCTPGEPSFDDESPTFNPDIRFVFAAPTSGVYYLRMFNDIPTTYGADTVYHLSVQALQSIQPAGAVILVAGRYRDGDPLQQNIYNVTDALYAYALNQGGCQQEQIAYLAPVDRPGTTGLATKVALGEAITQWAADHLAPGQSLTLYMFDHGRVDGFHLDGVNGQLLSPLELDGWLDQLENAVSDVRVNIIIEACHSGSFIEPPKSLSGPGRVVIASTSPLAVAYASKTGAAFSDAFINALKQAPSLWTAFDEGTWSARLGHPDQMPWLDDSGNGQANEAALDGRLAAQRAFACTVNAPQENWPPHITEATFEPLVGKQVQLRAVAQDDEQVAGMWSLIYPPSWQRPRSSDELIADPDPVILPRGQDGFGGEYVLREMEVGLYRVAFHAQDSKNLVAWPLQIKACIGDVCVEPGSPQTFHIPVDTLSTTIDIPVGAITATTTFTYTGFTDLDPSATLRMTAALRMAGDEFAGRGFDLTAYQYGARQSGFTFQRPVTLTVRYSDADVVGLDESTLAPHWLDGTTWRTTGLTVTRHVTVTNRLVIQAAHAATFALFGQGAAPPHSVYLPLVLRK